MEVHMNKHEIIELLKQDMMDEHQAIIQYLFHAYVMEEGEIPGEIEAVAREEMRHLDWLAEAIVELGGDPTMERHPPDFTLAHVETLMRKDVDLEQGAIDQYRAQIEMIDDEKIRRLLSRILSDELAHQKIFAGLADEGREMEEAGQEVVREELLGGDDDEKPATRLADILNLGVRHEYTVILQYLYHSFVAEGKELAEELEDTAINEMQHMGWLAEALTERGGHPDMNHTALFLSRDPEKNLEANIAAEQEVTRDYTTQLVEIDDEDLGELVERIRDHEIYHDAVFKDLLHEVREELEEAGEAEEASDDEAPAKPSRTIPSVGSLLGEDQW
jgi:bacterioferritin